MAMVNFKKGLLANLPSEKSAGTLYITTDERALYLDVDSSTRIRLGDFIEVASVSALPVAGASQTALYYATAENVLAKWNGTEWVQINPDTKYTFSTPTEADYNKGYIKIQANVAGAQPIYVKVSGLGDAAYTTVSALEGAMDSKVSALATGAVAQNTAAIADINNASTGILAQAKTYADSKASDAETAAKGYADEVAGAAETSAKGYADTKAAAAEAATKTYTDGKDTAMGTRVGAVEGRMTTAESDIDALEGLVGSTSVASQISTAIAAEDALAQGYADDAEAAAKAYTDELEGELADVAKSGAAADVAVDNESVAATNLDDAITELVEMIGTGGSDSVVTVEKSTSVEGVAARYTIKQGGTAVTGGVIDIPKDMVIESGSVVTNPDGQPAGTYLKLVLANATEDIIYINVSTLIEYVTAGDDTATCHVTISADHKVQVNVIAGSIGATQLDTATNNALAKAHEHSNKTVLDGITSAKVSAWDAAEQNAKHYADGLDAAMDARMDAAEAAITTLNGADTVTGSVAKQVKDAKAAVEAEIAALEEGAVAQNTAAISAIKDGTTIDSFSDVETALGGKVDKITGSSLVADTKVAAYDAHVANSDIHVTAAQKTAWTAKQDALVFNTAYDASANKVATMADIQNGLSWGSF